MRGRAWAVLVPVLIVLGWLALPKAADESPPIPTPPPPATVVAGVPAPAARAPSPGASTSFSPEIPVPPLPRTGVRLTVERWGELEDPLIVAFRGEVEEGRDPFAPVQVMGIPDEESGEVVRAVEAERVFEDGVVREVPAPAAGSDTVLESGFDTDAWTYFVRRGTRVGAIYGRGTVTMVEGEIVPLRIATVPLSSGPRHPVKVIARIPALWDVLGREGRGYVEEFDVEIAQDTFVTDPGAVFRMQGLDPLTRHLVGWAHAAEPDRDGLWRATTSIPLPSGRYRVNVEPIGWETDVVVSGDAPEVVLDLPEPGAIRIALVDDASGRAVPQGRVELRSEGWPVRRVLGILDFDSRTGTGLLRAVPGVYRSFSEAPGYILARHDLAFTAGVTQEVRVALRPAASVLVRLKGNEGPYRGSFSVRVAPRAADGTQRLRPEGEQCAGWACDGAKSENGVVRLDGLLGGPHEVTVTKLEGFEDPVARQVDLQPGATTEVVFDLVPAK